MLTSAPVETREDADVVSVDIDAVISNEDAEEGTEE